MRRLICLASAFDLTGSGRLLLRVPAGAVGYLRMLRHVEHSAWKCVAFLCVIYVIGPTAERDRASEPLRVEAVAPRSLA